MNEALNSGSAFLSRAISRYNSADFCKIRFESALSEMIGSIFLNSICICRFKNIYLKYFLLLKKLRGRPSKCTFIMHFIRKVDMIILISW